MAIVHPDYLVLAYDLGWAVGLNPLRIALAVVWSLDQRKG